MSPQENNIGEATDDAERRFPLDGVAHERGIAIGFELVHVTQPFEGAVDHLIDKAMRPIEASDFGDEALPDAKMTPFERDQIAELEQSVSAAGFDDVLGRECG